MNIKAIEHINKVIVNPKHIHNPNSKRGGKVTIVDGKVSEVILHEKQPTVNT